MGRLFRHFNLSDSELASFAGNLVSSMERDAAEFEQRGVSAADILALKDLKDAYWKVPPDEVYLGELMSEVDKKDGYRAELFAGMQKVSGFFEQKYGPDSNEYKQLEISGAGRFSEDNLIAAGRQLARIAGEYLPVLSGIGLTQAMIDAVQSACDSFENSATKTAKIKAVRAEKTAERIEKGNEIYEYVKKYCAIGKLIWENVSYADWDDYLIYKGRSKKYYKGKKKRFE